MKPYKHAAASEHRYGPGHDYQAVHDFLDMSKLAHATMAHRHLLHNELGCWLAGLAFGEWAVKVAIDHVLEDLGRVPTTKECEETVRLPGVRLKLLRSWDIPDDAELIMGKSPLLHNSLGPFVLEKILGPKSRQWGEDYILREYGWIPSAHEVVCGTGLLPIDRAMGMRKIKKREANENRTEDSAQRDG